MSLKKWRQKAKVEAEVEKQEDEIRRKFKTNKIAKEFGQVEAEKLLKAVTTRLDRGLEKGGSCSKAGRYTTAVARRKKGAEMNPPPSP